MTREEYLGFETKHKKHPMRIIVSLIFICMIAAILLTQEQVKIRKATDTLYGKVRMSRRN